MAARLFFFRRDICPRPECALLDNLPIVSFSLSEKTVSQNRFFLFASEDNIFSVQGRPPSRPQRSPDEFYLIFLEKIWQPVWRHWNEATIWKIMVLTVWGKFLSISRFIFLPWVWFGLVKRSVFLMNPPSPKRQRCSSRGSYSPKSNSLNLER